MLFGCYIDRCPIILCIGEDNLPYPSTSDESDSVYIAVPDASGKLV